MENLTELIQKKRKQVTAIIYGYIIIIGGAVFPILPINTQLYQGEIFWLVWFVRLLMVPTYFNVALVFYGLYNKRPLFVFFATFVLNSIGLICRIFLEWGEYSITLQLTPLNVGIHLFLSPILITIIYIQLTMVTHKK